MLKIVKIGGNVIDNPVRLGKFIGDFADLEGPKVLVHGGGKIATSISASLGIEARMVSGRRVTDPETLRVVTMVYAGLINKDIAARLNAAGCLAAGICGADAGTITCVKRSPEPVDYGLVGDPSATNPLLIRTMTANSITPVVAPITSDGNGQLLNTNADTVARAIASSLASTGEGVELVYCFEKDGVLYDVEDDASVIPNIDTERYRSLLAEGRVADGMLPKLENAFGALSEGVGKVVICNADNLLWPGYGGTAISL